MGFRVEWVEGHESLTVDCFGYVTFPERLECLDQQIFNVREFDLREILVDLSTMCPSNNPLDDLYFGEAIVVKREAFTNARFTVIHPSGYDATLQASRFLRYAGLNMCDYRIAPGKLRAPIKILT